MARQSNINAFSEDAAADLSTKQFFLMKMTSTGINIMAATTEETIGVLQNKPSALGDPAEIYGVGSISKVVAGAAVAKGARVMSDAAGKAITATSTNKVIGQALEAATADGDIITVMVDNRGTF